MPLPAPVMTATLPVSSGSTVPPSNASRTRVPRHPGRPFFSTDIRSPAGVSQGQLRVSADHPHDLIDNEERPVDAITLLKADHADVEKLFKAYEQLGDRALKSKQKTVSNIVKALSIHAAIEEQVFYPAVRAE